MAAITVLTLPPREAAAQCTFHPGHFSNTQVGNTVLMQSNVDLLVGLTAGLGETYSHDAVVQDAAGYQISTMVPNMDSVRNRSSCYQPIDPGTLKYISPGVQTGVAALLGQLRDGQILTSVGHTCGGSMKYQIHGYADYVPNSQCARFAIDSCGIANPGPNTYPAAVVRPLADGLWGQVRALIGGRIGFWSSLFCSLVGVTNDNIKSRGANQVLNEILYGTGTETSTYVNYSYGPSGVPSITNVVTPDRLKATGVKGPVTYIQSYYTCDNVSPNVYVYRTGTGSGTVRDGFGDTGGVIINCGNQCSGYVAPPTPTFYSDGSPAELVLNATPSDGSYFAGWDEYTMPVIHWNCVEGGCYPPWWTMGRFVARFNSNTAPPPATCEPGEPKGSGNQAAQYSGIYDYYCGYYYYSGYGWDWNGYCTQAGNSAITAGAGTRTAGTGSCSGGSYYNYMAGLNNYYCRYYEYYGYGWDYSGYCTQARAYASQGGCSSCLPATQQNSGPCGEASCVANQGAYISHFTNSDCTGTESYYLPYDSWGYACRSHDGQGQCGTIHRTVTNRSYKMSGYCYQNAWPNGNTLNDFVTVYR